MIGVVILLGIFLVWLVLGLAYFVNKQQSKPRNRVWTQAEREAAQDAKERRLEDEAFDALSYQEQQDEMWGPRRPDPETREAHGRAPWSVRK